MNIEQKLEFIKTALEMGADIDVKFHEVYSKQEAEKIASEFSEMLNITYEERTNSGTKWFQLEDYKKGVHITVFYALSKEEKKELLQKQLDELNKNEEVQA